MTREEEMWKSVEEEHGELLRREALIALTAMEWADENNPVDWQQVRIQAAIAAMQGILASKTMMEVVDATVKIGESYGKEVSADSVVSNISVGFADALVKELKGE